ncbi:dynein regulatory complex subunit 3 [Thunnus albacares]|uniref:dynein regulatory complex subunit 3 n=1 Tax=Thunnus albacares TaxID=8236 RepID=UPI001CF6D477|nr:dynein regulatory complex subunit 3 [Thunnus albacares]XP_044186082.1 dynein regulatory complex subunit 3 [Thunnus albacares]
MSHYFIHFQPILTEDAVLKKAIIEESPQDVAELIAKMKGIILDEVSNLCLQYRNILKIDHLWECKSLTKLELNNNIIKKIEGLDCLINLTWLDLSFNSIEKIEGLESLRKLEVLNLSNNKIPVIENMDTLEKLTFFCFSNNLVGQLDNVLYLRTFKNLFTLNLLGNPVSEEGDYKLFIAAYFPNLNCLDYRYLDEKTKKEALIKYHYDLEKMKRDGLQMQQAAEAKQRQEAELQLHHDAFVEFLDGSYLFKDMFKDDPEADKIHYLPEVATLLHTFEHQMVELCVQLCEIGLAEHKRREAEVNSFFSGHSKAVPHYQLRASQILANFEQKHKEKIEELQHLSEPELLKVKVTQCNDEIDLLCNNLMELDFQLVSQLEDIIKKLDTNISDMVVIFSETAQGTFAQCRDLEDDYNEKVREIAVATLEKVAKDKLEEDIPDDVRMLFTDKDTVMDALATGHDNHLLKINDRETQLVTRINTWKVTLIKGIQDTELKRSRMRISGIHRYMDYLREQLEELQ